MNYSAKSFFLASMLLSLPYSASVFSKTEYSSNNHKQSLVGTYALTWSVLLASGETQTFYSNTTFNSDGSLDGGNTVEIGQALKFLDPAGNFSVLATPQTGIWRKTDCGYEVSWIHVVATNTVPSVPAYWAKFAGTFKVAKDCKTVEGKINLNLFALDDSTFCTPVVGPVAITVTGDKLAFHPNCQ